MLAGCVADGATCDNVTLAIGDSQCCSGICLASGICDSSGCKAGDTRVRIQESPAPVALRDVKTGQHIQCVDASDDMRVPTKLAWCEVHNWVSATAGWGCEAEVVTSSPHYT